MVIKLKDPEMGRLYWVVQVDYNPKCPQKMQVEGDFKQTEEEKVR